MDPKLYLPFVKATIECFQTMVDIDLTLKDASTRLPPIEQKELCAILGLSGDAIGLACVALSKEVALKTVSNFMGENLTEINEDVFDAIGEIINIIGGAAKSEYSDMKLSISLPSIMHGEKFYLSLPKGAPVVTLLFDSPDLGEISLVVSLKKS